MGEGFAMNTSPLNVKALSLEIRLCVSAAFKLKSRTHSKKYIVYYCLVITYIFTEMSVLQNSTYLYFEKGTVFSVLFR